MDEEVNESAGLAPLRHHAKQLERDLKATREENLTLQAEIAGYRRRDAFEDSRAQLDPERARDVRLEDVADLPPEEVTPEVLLVRASERTAARDAMFAEQAEQLGLTSEQYQSAILNVAAKEQQARIDLASAGVLAAGGSAPPPPERTPSQRGEDAWQEARAEGRSQDVAAAEAVGAMTEAQIGRGNRRFPG